MRIRDALRVGTGKQPAKAVVAAAMPMNGPGVVRVNRSRAHVTQEQWQEQAWYYFDVIGEARGPMVWIANAVSQADLHATELDPDTGKPTGPTEDTRAVAAANMVLGGPAQRAQLLRTVALCWQVPGEAWIIIRPRTGTLPDEWLILSGNKVRAKGESWTYTDPYTGANVTLTARERLIRVWQPHPNDQAKADSAMRPALPICREIEKSSQALAARLDSRLANNGAWLLPEEIDYPRGDHPTVGAAIMDLFLDIAERGIQNPGQAAAAVPIVFTIPGEQIANAVYQDFATEFSGAMVELRQAALERLAATLDMPRDVAEGTQGEANHWSAWQVEESTYKIFIEPLLKAVGDALTEEWYRPALIAMGMSPEEADRYEIGWDTTAIVARPDDTEVLRWAYENLLVSDEYARTENGISEEAAPDDEERTRRLLEKAIQVAPTLLADPNVATAIGLDITVAPAAAGVDAEVNASGELETPEPPAPVVRALPGTQGDEPVPEGLVAAAELIVYDALSRAGGRLLTNQNRGQFKSTPRHELHTVIRVGEHAIPGLREGSFEFTEPVAEAFGLDPARFRQSVLGYTTELIRHGSAHEREGLRQALGYAWRKR